jgi:hypothetical protein
MLQRFAAAQQEFGLTLPDLHIEIMPIKKANAQI